MLFEKMMPTPHIDEPSREIVHTEGEEGAVLVTPSAEARRMLAIPREYPAVGLAWFGIQPEAWDAPGENSDNGQAS